MQWYRRAGTDVISCSVPWRMAMTYAEPRSTCEQCFDFFPNYIVLKIPNTCACVRSFM